MKEVIAIVRMNMVEKTKQALLKEEISSITCHKVVGRGKKKVNFSIIEDAFSDEASIGRNLAEEISEIHRLIPKRMLTILLKDEDVERAVNAIIAANKTGNPGDGKIFVSDVTEAVRVRTGETGDAAL